MHARRLAAAGAAATAAALAIACGSDPSGPRIPRDASAVFWSTEIDHRGVTLSTVQPYDTLRIDATPLDVNGRPLSIAVTPAFRSLDPTVVGVDSTGLLSARRAGRAIVLVSLTAGDVTEQDTVDVAVTTSSVASPLASLSLVPPPSVSVGFYALLFPQTVVATARDTANATMPGVMVQFQSLDKTTLTIDRITGVMSPVRIGMARVAATATAYGVTRVDTIPVVVGSARLQLVSSPIRRTADGRTGRVFDPGTITLVQGGSVAFVNGTLIDHPADSIDVTFDKPAQVGMDQTFCFCGSGNIGPFVTPFFWNLFSHMRSFPDTGTFTYRSTITGATGKIVVVPQ